MPDLVALIPAVLVVALLPGPATVMLINQSARGSRRTAMATVAGIETGVLCWGVAAAFGLSALLVASQLAYDILRVAGAAYLVYLGVRALVRRRHDLAGPDEAGAGAGFTAGLLINLGNPKAGVFAISFLPQFVPAETAGPFPLLVCVLVWMAVDTLWYSSLALLVARLGRWLRSARARRVLDRTTGGLLIGFGVSVALEGR